jgi:drug/metabolite transporter (DMT)-like permease
MKNKTIPKLISHHSTWFVVALVGTLLAAPNGLVVKLTVGEISPFLMNALRFTVVAIVCAPVVWRVRHSITKKQLIGVIYIGFYITIAVSAFVSAVKLSQASYVAIVTLLTPVVLLIYSVKLYGERLSQRTITGVALAAMGAMVLVVLPFARQGGPAFYPMATFLTLLNCFSYPLAIIQTKRVNESGVPMMAIIGLSSLIVATLSGIILAMSSTSIQLPSGGEWMGILYSGVAVALLSRMFKIWGYEHIGTGATSALMYLETFLGILLPILILHEKMSIVTVVGGLFVLFGVYIVESHKLLAHKHHHYWRSH